MIAFTAAIAVNAAMTAAFVDIHVIVDAKPGITGSEARDNCFCRNKLHIKTLFILL
jgi:hypothetical protein